MGGGGPSSKEGYAGCTRAVANTNGASELDEVTGGDVPLLNKGCLGIDNVIDTTVCVVGGLSVGECDNRAVCASTAELALASEGRRETDSVMEGQTERLMDLFTTFASIKE